MVYKAKLSSGDVVAVKRAKADRKQDAGKFRKEIELLSRVSHKNLVRLVGYCREGGEQLLVYEYVAGGNLSQNLNPTWRERHSRPPLNWTERLLIAAGTARGLAYLHEEINVPFIHRDVKPSNIMIDRHVVAKIADFGTTKPMTPEELRKMSVTIQGTAPSNVMIDRHVVAKVADFGTSKPMTPEELRKTSVTIQGTAVSALGSACCECSRVVEWRVSPVPLADFGTSKPMTPEGLQKMSVTIQGTAVSALGSACCECSRVVEWQVSPVPLADFGTSKPMTPEELRKMSVTIQGTSGYCNPDYLPGPFIPFHTAPHTPPSRANPFPLRATATRAICTGGTSYPVPSSHSPCLCLPSLVPFLRPSGLLRPGLSAHGALLRAHRHGYCDPDYLRTGHSSKRIDVYSLGIVLLELLTGKGPHKVNRPYRFDVKDRFDRGGLPSIVDPTMGLYPADELHHVFDLALRCTDIQNPAARPSMSRVVAELEAVLEPEAISRFISSGPPSHDSADFRTAPSGSGAGPGGAGLTRFAGAGKQVGQGGGEGGAGLAAAGSGVEGLAVGGTAGAALAAAISSASPSRSDAGDSPLTPDPPIPPNRSQPQPTPACYAPLPPPSSKRTPGPPAYKGRAAGVAAAGASEATGGDIRGMRDRELDGACVPTGQNDPRSTGGTYVVSHDVGVQMKPAPVAAFRGASAAAGGGATGAGVIVAGASGGNAGRIGGGGGVAAPNQEYRAGEGFGEGEGGGERGEGGYEEGLDASFDSSGFDRSGVFSYGAMPPA
ncbi:unnamed protein product [Closterium sp. NIES-65]|nr:unnamed protein product [Closterium sp. NIES-65]